MKLIKTAVIFLITLTVIFFGIFFYFQTVQKNAYTNLAKDLNLLRDLSIKNQDPIMQDDCIKVRGYMFESRQDNNYKLVEWCSNGYFTFKEVNLNKYVLSIKPTFPTTTFKVKGSPTNLSDSNPITLLHKFLGKDYSVTISANAEIIK